MEYFGTDRYDLAGQMVSQDYVDHEAPPGTPPGPEGANAVLRWLRGAFADLSYEICDAFGDGDRAAVRVITRGTHTGEFMGTRPTGKQFEIEAIHLYRIQDGKVAKHWAKRDDVGLATQLGSSATDHHQRPAHARPGTHTRPGVTLAGARTGSPGPRGKAHLPSTASAQADA